MKQGFYIFIFIVFSCLKGRAQADFVENKGQWPDQVRFKTDLPGGAMWAEDHGFTYRFYDQKILEYLHPTGGEISGTPLFRSHAYKVNFLGSRLPIVTGSKPERHYFNYYQGDDESKWVNHCRIFSRCDYESIYEGVDLVLYSTSNAVKYDFIVHPGGSPKEIKLSVEGAQVKLEHDLTITTSVNVITEKAPFAYQMINGSMLEVSCDFVMKNGEISFKLGKYDHSIDLVIDPEIAFSTYIGSTASNFGFTACDDSEGNLISGAAVFADEYPVTTGAFESNFNSGLGNYMDIAISKFSPDGAQLLYSTYIGGSGQETPHSVVADSNDHFIVYGVSGSTDYPTTAGVFQPNFIGGPFLSMADFFTSFHGDGTDIIVSKFNSDGALNASTYIGGTENDGLNFADQLFYNYGDAFRGEVNVDASDNIFIASVTLSTDFPMAGNSTQGAYGGGASDGIVLKLDGSLSNLLWSTYFGGNLADACYALEFEIDGTITVAGGTQSADFPHVVSGADMSQNGETDGFISLLNATNFNLVSGTFVGTPDYDQIYFVQIDAGGNLYCYGQTAGDMPITAGQYGQANSGQFVSKYTSNLSSLVWNTTIGTGSGEIDISPTAFLVSDCEQIYLSGWGGNVNSSFCSFNPCYATSSTTNGLPVTADAFQLTTDGSDFYLCVLTPNAADLLYGSFLGGTESAEHVDGGTSRFDKNGSVYQAVCAGCQNNDDFPTTPGAYSNTNESFGCNIAVFRFDLNAVQAHVEIDGPNEVCVDTPISFINQSVGASSYQWNFGDGTSSTDFQPTHTYTEGGTYTITLIGLDNALCVNSDTAEVTVTILPGVNPTVDAVDIICQGENIQLNATGSANLLWANSPTLSATNIPDPIATPLTTTTYFVIDYNDCDADTLPVLVTVSILQTQISEDVSLCIGESTQLEAGGGVSYSWSPSTGLNNATLPNPVCTPLITTDYTVTITNVDDCSVEEVVQVIVFNNNPGGAVYDDIELCEGDYVQLTSNPGIFWLWSPASSLSNATVQEPYATPLDTTTYAVLITNACGQGTDFVTVNVLHPNIVAFGGGTICVGNSVSAFAIGGVNYYWEPPSAATPSDEDSTSLSPSESMWITVTGIDETGCGAMDSVYVFVLPLAAVDAGPDQYFQYPGSAYLFGNSFGLDYEWSPAEGLSCIDCLYPLASPENEIFYTLSVTDHNGCVAVDSVFVKPYFPVWVPNTITPDNDGINDYFRAYGINIEGFHLLIFDRWGLKIFESNDIEEVWTGGVSGEYYVQNDVYNWVIEYDSVDRKTTISGHVTVVR